MRRPLIVGAQKLYLSLNDSVEFARQLVKAVDNKRSPFDIAVCPSFVNLAYVANILRESPIAIGAQNVHQENSGAYTGQVSIQELLGLGVQYVIVGHSELRNQQGETNGMVRQKAKIALKHKVIPIVCIGENKEEREAGRSEEVIERDIREIFTGIPKDDFADENNVVVAYEPVWAIKAGRDDKSTVAASPGLADDTHEFIQDILSSIYGSDVAEMIRILYGGSVSPENTKDLLKEPSIDGLLIGTASVKIESFLKILEAAEEIVSKGGRHVTTTESAC
jgi:triosephosphate isomerase